ncbi:MAG: Ig-like domain-containing protein, partial [Pseudolabrys sp.]
MSFAFLAGVAALEAREVANKLYRSGPDGPNANHEGHDADSAGPALGLDQATHAQAGSQSNAGTSSDRHIEVEDTTAVAPQMDTSPSETHRNHPIATVGSSTAPQIIAEPIPANLEINATGTGTSPVSGSDIKVSSAGTAAVVPNQVGILFVGPVGNPAPQPNPTTVSSVVTSGAGIDGSGNGDLNAGHVVTLTVAMSEVVTVAGGIPTLSLNNGGTASYSGGSGSNTLTFSYTVGAGQDTSDLAVTSFNLNGATVSDPAGNDAIVAGAVSNPSGILQIDTTAPTVPSISSITLGGSGGNHWVFTGTAEANSSIAVFDGNTQLTTVAASGLGAWNYTTTGAVTNASIHNFTATASDAAGNTSAFLASWIEGTAGNDTFSFNSEGQLIAPALINGNGGADTIAMTAPVTLNSGDFANVSAVQSLQLTGANVVTLGADAVTAGIVNVITGNGATSIADPNSGTLTTINATALLDNTALSLSGAAGFTVTGLQGDLTATGVSGALNVTTVA